MQFNRVNNKKHLCSLVVRSVNTYEGASEFHMLVDCNIVNGKHFLLEFYISFSEAVHRPGNSPPSFHCFNSMTGASSSYCMEGSWLGCQDLPAMGAVFIYYLAANSGSSFMSQAPNLHFSDAVVNYH